MASRQKNRSRPAPKSSDVLSKLGISLEIPDFNENADVSDDEEDLESELQALLTGKQTAKPVKQPKSSANVADLDKMVAVCMKNSSTDEDDDDNVSGDEALLAELHTLTKEETQKQKPIEEHVQHNNTSDVSESTSIIDMLQERLNLYQEAEAIAKNMGDSSKVRRYGRAIKTLKGLLSSAKSGNSINDDDIPPIVPMPKPAISSVSEPVPVISSEPVPPVPSRSAPFVPLRPAPSIPESSTSYDTVMHQGSVSETTSVDLIARRNQYKVAALNAKRAGDNETALKYVKTAKKFDVVIEAVQNGQSVDLSNMPPPPPECAAVGNKPSHISSTTPMQPERVESEKTQSAATDMEAAALAAANEPADPTMFSAPEAPSTVLEALEQRLEKYHSTRDTAQNEGNISKARRLQRIVKQYEAAIKDYKAGKPIDFSELPAPPGFAPIPFENSQLVSSPMVSKDNDQQLVDRTNILSKGKNIPSQPLPPSKAAQPGTSGESSPPKGKHPRVQRANTSTILEKQLHFLLERQKLFRQAALEAKKNGDIQQAKEYLRMSKGFDSMIDATKSGLPIDATTIPTPPQLEADFVIIDKSDCFDQSSNEKVGFFPNLEKELQHQIEMCSRNKEHFMRLGDVSSASKFEKLGLDTKKDLAVIQHLWRNNDQVPHFHYETRLFSLVQCNTDLADNEIEVTIERGINLPGKSDDLDAYVKIEFPIPTENPQRAKTHTVRNTNNPIYQEVFKFEINRKSRSQLRQFKRQALKCEIWSKGGFFRSDLLLGTAMVKLVDLETKCEVHDSFDLLDGRKVCGGKLEIKIRIRDPMLTKQVEQVKEKWLVIES